MKTRILIRYGELSTKGRNKKMFTQKLASNIKKALVDYPQVKVIPDYDFMYLDLHEAPEEAVIEKVKPIFGIQSISPVYIIEKDMEVAKKVVLDLLSQENLEGKTFKIMTKRSDHTFEMDTNQINLFLGDAVLEAFPEIKVQLKQNGENYGEAIELSKANDWKYTFKELPESNKGVAYEYTVEEVDIPEGYTHEVTTEGTNSVITNRILSAIKQDLTFKKELEGRDLVEGEFTFNLLDENGNVIQTAKNAADGSITFKDVAFEKAGTYNYSVVEVSGDDAQITYDKSVKKVSIEVKQEDKAYVATVTYDADTTFKNKYTAPAIPTPEPSKPQKDLPNTGTSSLVNTMLIATVLVMIALGFVYTSKKEN